jgi:hypothetical protein
MFHLGQSYTRFPLAKESNFYLTCVDGKVNLAKQVELKHLLLVILVSQPLLTHSDKSVELKQLLLVILVSQLCSLIQKSQWSLHVASTRWRAPKASASYIPQKDSV